MWFIFGVLDSTPPRGARWEHSGLAPWQYLYCAANIEHCGAGVVVLEALEAFSEEEIFSPQPLQNKGPYHNTTIARKQLKD